MKRLGIALLLMALPVAATAQDAAPDVAGAKALWAGNQLFCKNCHGRDGEGAFGPDLAGRGLSASQFKQAVRKPWGVMPAFTEEQLSDSEIAGLTTYFNALPKPAEPGPSGPRARRRAAGEAEGGRRQPSRRSPEQRPGAPRRSRREPCGHRVRAG